MRAVTRLPGRLSVEDMEAPVPGSGHVLLKGLACGICGSDLHALDHLEHVMEIERSINRTFEMDTSKPIVFGHEFCGEILDHGPDTARRLAAGTRVVSMPIIFGSKGASSIGFSDHFPGGFAQQFLVQEALLLEVPNGLPSDQAALTEPMAVGIHAVALAALTLHSVAYVVGCGPVGLAVIAALKRAKVGPIIATDFSPLRRAMALRMGADIVLDPQTDDVAAQWLAADVPPDIAAFEAAAFARREIRDAVVFECVGVPGMIDRLIRTVPPAAQIIVVGHCMESDRFEPCLAIRKQLRLAFSFGYSATEFEHSLNAIAQGDVDVTPLITGHVGLMDVDAAFTRLGGSVEDVKIIVDPRLG